jgi:hypothetical protein
MRNVPDDVVLTIDESSRATRFHPVAYKALMRAPSSVPIGKPCEVASDRTASALVCTVYVVGCTLTPETVHEAARSAPDGRLHVVENDGGRIRGAVASSSAESHPSWAHAIVAPGRAGTSQRTSVEPGIVISLHRVVRFAGETAVATRTLRRGGSARPSVGTTAPPASACVGTTREARTDAARNAK